MNVAARARHPLSQWRKTLVLLAAPAALALSSGDRPTSPNSRALPGPAALAVFAAASLTDAFPELGQAIERSHPGLTVRFNFAGSQQLALQLAQGAVADVFASADQRWMSHVQEQELVAQAPGVFARNRLVVIVPQANPGRIGTLRALVRPGIKLVIAAEAVPAGRYSREALSRLAAAPGFPPAYDRKVLANVVSEEENVKAVVAKVQLGEADAGVVYRSDVTPAVAGRLRVLDIPDPYNVLASYPIAVLKAAPNPEAAGAFVDLVVSAEGQRVLRKHGLLPAEADASAPASAAEPAHP